MLKHFPRLRRRIANTPAVKIDRPLQIAVIGLGNQGQEHVQALEQTTLPVRLAAVVDPRGWPEGSTPRPALPLYASVEALPKAIHAVIVAIPPVFYRQVVPTLLEAGKHVLLEKPVGISLAEALELATLAQRCRCALIPTRQRRFHPAYKLTPEWKEKTGTFIEADIRLAIRHEGEGWRSSRETAGGGALFDLGFHAIDLAQQMFGDLKLRSACFFDREDFPEHSGMDFKADLLLETETFLPVRVRVERGAPEKQERVRFRGSLGTVKTSRQSLSFTDNAGHRVETVFNPDWTVAMQSQMAEWLDHIDLCEAGSRAAWDPLWTGVSTMKLMEEAYAHGRF